MRREIGMTYFGWSPAHDERGEIAMDIVNQFHLSKIILELKYRINRYFKQDFVKNHGMYPRAIHA